MNTEFFKELLTEFASRLKTTPPSQEDINTGEVELNVEGSRILFTPNNLGGLVMTLPLGLFLHPVKEEHLSLLLQSNFLGVDTGGCTLALDASGVLLLLKIMTTKTTSLQENWEWLHRLFNVASAWAKALRDWDEFVVLMPSPESFKEQKPFNMRL